MALHGGTGTPVETGSWTPVVSAGSGAIVSYTASGTYTKVGRMVTCSVNITITDNGTGATRVNCSLPFAVSGDHVGIGRENGVSGSALQVLVTNAVANAAIYTYNNAYPGATGAIIYFTLSYFV